MTDDAWITESIVQLSRSPLWRTPVDDFVDENCFLFDENPMTVEQTELHLKFRAMIDDLLTSYVNDIGVSLEVALNAVKNAVDNPSSPSRDAATSFLNNIFYVDDFRSFHKMMVKRNIELDILAHRELQRRAASKKGGVKPLSSDQEHPVRSSRDEEEDALRLAIAASLKDNEESHKLIELEDVQIQEALALSIAAEEDRVRQATMAVCKEVALDAAQVGPAEAEQRKAQKLNALEEEKAHNIMKLETRALEVRQEALRRGLTATHEVAPTSGSPSPDKRSAPSSPNAEKAKATAAAAPSSSPPAAPVATAAASKLPLTPPRSSPAKQFGFKALPSIQPSLKQLEAAMVKPEPTSAAKPVDQNAKNTGGPTLEEMEARAKYMREQREKIVAQNKANRNQELEKYKKDGGAAATNTSSAPVDRESNMTVTLARRLREDIIREVKK